MITETRVQDFYGCPFTLHSQPETEQDAWVIRTLKCKRDGLFIEIGAFDGIYHSNTLTLERELGWNGILIEADPYYATYAARARQARVLNYTVSPVSRSEAFFVARQWGGLVNYTRPNLLANHAVYRNPIEWRPTVDLSNILRPENLPAIVDYLSIDVEGAEYPILKSYLNSPDARRFRCITIEVGESQDDLGKLIDLLRPLGYRLDRVQAWDAFFIHPELL